MKQFGLLAVFVLVSATVMALVPMDAMAQTAGQDLLADIENAVTGNLGLMIGLGISLLGLYMWIIEQASWGIMVIIGGVVVTAFPGFFNSLHEGVKDFFGSTLGGSSLSTVSESAESNG